MITYRYIYGWYYNAILIQTLMVGKHVVTIIIRCHQLGF